MTEKPKWGIGSEQYKKRPGAGSSPARLHRQGAKAPLPHGYQLRGDTGRVFWERGEVDLELITHSSVERTVFRFEQALPDFIWNAAALEGNTFTLPEVRTLLDGVTVGGKPLGDAEQILNLSEALNLVTGQVRNGSFRLNQETSDQINAIVVRNEIIEPGVIRGTGYVHGGGTVSLPDGETIDGDSYGDDRQQLVRDFSNLLTAVGGMEDPREQALAYCVSAIRSQFYGDGNKRTARAMMIGHLMSNGYAAISVPYSRLLEYNVALEDLFKTDDATDLMQFLATCSG